MQQGPELSRDLGNEVGPRVEGKRRTEGARLRYGLVSPTMVMVVIANTLRSPNNCVFMRPLAIAVLLFATCISGYAQHPWENGHSETLWRQRYGNCDYGMFMLLPNGVVGHGTLPPAPNHGIAIRLPDVGSTTEVDVDKQNRYVWVNAEYNVSDDSSRNGTAEHYISLHTAGKHGTITKQVAKLGPLPATRLKIAYESPSGLVIEEVVVAQRANIVYEIGLRTNSSDYTQDLHRFEQLMSGFRLSPLPKGQCSNG